VFRLYEGGYVPWKAPAKGAKAQGPRNLIANPSFETGAKPWWFQYREKRNARRTCRRASFVLTRVLANMGVAAPTPLLAHISTPPGAGADRATLLKNGDFSVDADRDGVADNWTCEVSGKGTVRARERVEPGADEWAQRATSARPDEKGRSGVMLAQHGVPVREGQWYRISFRAKAQGMQGATINFTVQNTKTWSSFFQYQAFTPDERWRRFTFLVQSKGTEDSRTRFQLWHSGVGTVWYSDMSMVPCEPPSQGRWLAGLYLDEPAKWDDPYRFFRW
jgi:hypothetical protein